jgi:Nif-specific regulatory protein
MTTETAVERRRRLELEILYRVSQAIAHQHNLTALLNEVLDIMETEMGLARGTVTLRQPDTDVFLIQASRGLGPEEVRRGQYRLGDGITGHVAQTGRGEVVPDVSREPRFLDLIQVPDRHNAFVCVPIIRDGFVIGTFSIDRPRANREDLDRDMEFMQLLANLLAESVASIREQIEERETLMAENRRLRQQIGDTYQPSNIIGNCRSMRHVYEQIAQVADSTATVLVRGESGTGKELVAGAIHYSSPRRANAFVAVNCAALPETLIESELFGHEKGAFTGADRQRRGRFQQANGGTLFLDEIGDISAQVQVRLLRVLQEQAFEPVGSDETVRVNVRVVAATSKDLESEMRKGNFREDLYYRLNVFPIHLPPLRERKSDIMLLADHFVRKYNEAYGKQVKRISTAAINMMMAYHWPGNVRELENCVERAVLTGVDEVIHGYQLPPSLQTDSETGTAILPASGASLKNLVDSYERELIIDALKRHRGNAAAAARALQTTQRIVNYRIAKLGIEPRKYK